MLLKDRASEVAINCNYDGYQRALANMVYKYSDKKTGLAEELHKPAIKKLKRRRSMQDLRIIFA